MNCPECLDWVQRRLDGDSIPSELEDHLLACSTCRQQHLTAQRMLEGVRTLIRPIPGEALTERIVVRVLADRGRRRLKLRRLVLRTAGLAAAIALIALAGYAWLPYARPRPDKIEVVKHPPVLPKEPSRADTPTLRQSVEEARLAVASLTERLAGKSKEQARWLWSAAPPLDVPMMNLPAVKELEQPLDPAAQTFLQAGEGVSEGIQTVTQSARRAVAYFMRELSPLEVKN